MSCRVKRKLLRDMARMSVDSDVESTDVDTSLERSAKRRSGVTFDDCLSNERKLEIRSHDGCGASVGSRRLSESKLSEYSCDKHEKQKPHTRLSAKTGSSHSVRRTVKTVSAGSDSDDDVTANVCFSKKRAKHSEKVRKVRFQSQASKYYMCNSDSDMGSSSPTRRAKDNVKERKERKIRWHFQRDKTPMSEYDSDDDVPLAKCKNTRQSLKFSKNVRKVCSHSQHDKTIVSEYTSDDSDDDASLVQTAKIARRKPSR